MTMRSPYRIQAKGMMKTKTPISRNETRKMMSSIARAKRMDTDTQSMRKHTMRSS